MIINIDHHAQTMGFKTGDLLMILSLSQYQWCVIILSFLESSIFQWCSGA
jgi:hypothetical protein